MYNTILMCRYNFLYMNFELIIELLILYLIIIELKKKDQVTNLCVAVHKKRGSDASFFFYVAIAIIFCNHIIPRFTKKNTLFIKFTHNFIRVLFQGNVLNIQNIRYILYHSFFFLSHLTYPHSLDKLSYIFHIEYIYYDHILHVLKRNNSQVLKRQ